MLYEWLYCICLIVLFLQLLFLLLLLFLLTREWTEICCIIMVLFPLLFLQDLNVLFQHIFKATLLHKLKYTLFISLCLSSSLFFWPCSGHLFQLSFAIWCIVSVIWQRSGRVEDQVKLRSNEQCKLVKTKQNHNGNAAENLHVRYVKSQCSFLYVTIPTFLNAVE